MFVGNNWLCTDPRLGAFKHKSRPALLYEYPGAAVDIDYPGRDHQSNAGYKTLALLEGRRVVKSSRAAYRLALLSLLLSMAMLSRPTIAEAADGGTAITVAIPRADTGSQEEPSSNAPVILRGTRPVTRAAAEAPNVRNRAPPPPYMGFVPAPYGSGWNTEYNYNGLNYTPPGGAAE